MLKVLYAGSPDAAAVALDLLLKNENLKKSGVEIAGILTNPPSAQGRHKTLIPTPVQTIAETAKISVFTPEHLDALCREQLTPLNADILVCFAYGHIFGPKFLSLFKFGGINLHPSLLPKYRGCTPVPAAILNRDKETGFSIQKIAQKMDAGDLLVQEKIPLDFTETSESLLNKSAQLGAGKIAQILMYTAQKNSLPESVPQKGEPTYTSIIKKEDGKIDWKKSAEEIDAQIRAYTPDPGCFTTGGGTSLKIIQAHPVSDTAENSAPGTVLSLDKKHGILIKCGTGVLAATELQWQAKKAMNYKDFMNGSRNFIGAVLQ